jgi:hypothetical protein
MVETADRTSPPGFSPAPAGLNPLSVSLHGSVPIFFPPYPLPLAFASPSPPPDSETPSTFYHPPICRIRRSSLVMLLYHYLVVQMFCGSLCMSCPGTILRNIFRGWPLDWCQRPHGRCITLRDVYVFAETLCYWALPSFVPPEN